MGFFLIDKNNGKQITLRNSGKIFKKKKIMGKFVFFKDKLK
jgi:hypothetical protein